MKVNIQDKSVGDSLHSYKTDCIPRKGEALTLMIKNGNQDEYEVKMFTVIGVNNVVQCNKVSMVENLLWVDVLVEPFRKLDGSLA